MGAKSYHGQPTGAQERSSKFTENCVPECRGGGHFGNFLIFYWRL